MKNIETILSELGIQIPADKKDSFNSQFGENYKTAEETNRLRTARKCFMRCFQLYFQTVL